MRAAPLVLVAVSVYFLSTLGCGRPADEVSDNVPLKGLTGFGSICPEGTFTRPKPKQLELLDCPLGLETVELAEPIQPLILQADCKEKILMIRTEDRSLDSSWEVMPDGSFNLTFAAGYAKLKDDGKGHFGCTVPLTLDIWGRIECNQPNRDKVDIKIETVWWMNKPAPEFGIPAASPTPNGPTASPTPSSSSRPSPRPTPTVSETPTPRSTGRRPVTPIGNQCTVPPSCYFHAKTLVKQCE